MAEIISGTFIGASGTAAAPAGGQALLLQNSTSSYTLTSVSIARGGDGYEFATGPAGAGGIGIALPAGGALTDFGTITGGRGSYLATGGTGVLFGAYGILRNHGAIGGGAGDDAAGGTGVDLAGGGLVGNSGKISGGAAASDYAYGVNGGTGGTALYFGDEGLLANTGIIAGGAGGAAGYGATGGGGGIGVVMNAYGAIGNSGMISGGRAGAGEVGPFDETLNGAAGGNAIDLDAGGFIVNTGSVAGGAGGEAPASTSPDLAHGGTGGTAIEAADGGVVFNAGHLTGGQGGTPNFQSSPFPVTGAAGGAGISLGAGGRLVNSGVIAGGKAGGAYKLDGQPIFGGAGGAGAVLTGGTAINDGTILGGSALPSGLANASGDGGLGVDLVAAGVFVNTGSIAGGAGGAGGVGIYLAGGSTLDNAGHIAGADGAAAAVFGNAGSSKLEIDASAVFSGTVSAGGIGNVIELRGGQPGTLSGLGSRFTGFQTADIDAGGSWAVSGSVETLKNAGLVDIQSGTSLAVTGAVESSSTGIFALTGKGSLEIAALLGTHAKIAFLGTTPDRLAIDDPGQFGLNLGSPAFAGPLLEDFGTGDVIDLKAIGTAGLGLHFNTASGVLQISASGGGIVASLQFQTVSLGAGSFHLATDGVNGSLLTRS